MTHPDLRLRAAAAERRACQVRTLDGAWIAGQLEALEPAGLVLTVPGAALAQGTDVRVWFNADDGPAEFSGQIVRDRVPLPGGHGLIVGLLARATAGDSTLAGSAVDLLNDDGGLVALLDAPNAVLALGGERLRIVVARSARAAPQLGDTVKLRLAAEGEAPCEVRGQVVECAFDDDGAVELVIAVTLVERADRFLRAVSGLRRVLGLLGPA